MRKLQLAIPVGLVALVMSSAVVRADQKKHEERYCTALGEVNSDVASLEALGPSSTMMELRGLVQRIQRNGKAIDREARKIKSAASKQFVQAADQLYTDIQTLPDTITMAEARSRIASDVRAVERTATRLAQESGCPENVPQAPAEQQQ